MDKAKILKNISAFSIIAILFLVRILFFEEPKFLSSLFLITTYFFIKTMPNKFISLAAPCCAGIILELIKAKTIIWVLPIVIIFWLLKNSEKGKLDYVISYSLLVIWIIAIAIWKKGFIEYQIKYSTRFFAFYNSVSLMLAVFAILLFILAVSAFIFNIKFKAQDKDIIDKINCIINICIFNIIYIFIILIYQGFNNQFSYYEIIISALIINKLPITKIREFIKT